MSWVYFGRGPEVLWLSFFREHIEFKKNMQAMRDLGTLREKETRRFTLELGKEVMSVVPDCGCTVGTVEGDRVYLDITPGKVPFGMNEYVMRREVKVVYADLTRESVNLTAVVKKS